MKSKNKLVTDANLMVSLICFAITFLAGCIDDEYIIFCIIVVQGIIFAYLCAYVGLKKGIKTGFWWGFILSFLGLIILAILPAENIKDTVKTNNISKSEENIELIKKYKELLEVGAITQEEFDVKKKELLK